MECSDPGKSSKIKCFAKIFNGFVHINASSKELILRRNFQKGIGKPDGLQKKFKYLWFKILQIVFFNIKLAISSHDFFFRQKFPMSYDEKSREVFEDLVFIICTLRFVLLVNAYLYYHNFEYQKIFYERKRRSTEC